MRSARLVRYDVHVVTIIFEAHATSVDNEAQLASGWADVPLSPVGEEQARDLGARYVGHAFDAIYCSDLQRSYRTAELAFRDAYPIVHDARLRECNYGDLNRAPASEVTLRKLAAVTTPFPNGESYEDAARRIRDFLDDLTDENSIMIIGHRATQYGLEHALRGVALEDAIRAPWQWQPGWTYELRQR
jgi:alpha-ribazole phosphatase/probable phosphoglycerate mutase